jgi:uncharacterized protein (TIGR02996 family)
MRTFEFKDAKSNKFWHIELSGSSFTVTFGRIGTTGQTQTKTFANAATAKKEHDKLVAEKLKKGYVETTAAATTTPAISSEQKALEAALVAHADEVAAHSAYGDYLMEQGDPRGEFIQTQLALEDATRSKADRDTLRNREAALLKKHASQWLGDAGRFLVGQWSGEDKPYCFRFARGWLDYLRVLPVPEAMIAAIARAPEARLLRRLEVIYDMRYHAFKFDQFTEGPAEQLREGERAGEIHDAHPSLPFLAESKYLTNLRVLKYGFSDDGERLAHSTMVRPFDDSTAELMIDLLKNCPRLEELYLNTDFTGIDEIFASKLLGNLRVFQYYYGISEYYGGSRPPPNPYPLSALAENKSLKHLTTLRFHPGRDATIDIDELDALLNSKNLPALAHLQVHMTTFGDEGVARIVSSDILKRLKTLDIGYGNMTDDGARKLAACSDLKKLDVLNVSRNALTGAGLTALRATGVQLVADHQHDADEQDYLYEVDRE